MRHVVTLALVALPLSGCGGGVAVAPDAGGATGPTAPMARGYAQVMAEAAGLNAAREGQHRIGRDALPTSGYADYAGYLTLQSAALPSEVVGDISLAVDFGDNDTVGFAGNFVGANGDVYDGSIHGGGSLVAAPGRVTAVTSLAGTIRSDGASYALGLTTRGDFLAPDGALIAGAATTRGGINGTDVNAGLILALD